MTDQLTPDQPSGDSAREAELLASDLADYFRRDYYGEQTRSIIERAIAFLRSTAPPKPSPDAMRALLADCRTFVIGMTKPSTSGLHSISSYHPCQALIDKIDAALATTASPANRARK